MYAMTGTLIAQAGKRDLLVNILVRASALVLTMPGCKAYIVLEDLKDEHAVAVFEMWEDKAAHDASLQNPQVRSLIAEAMPILGGAPSGGEYRVATNL